MKPSATTYGFFVSGFCEVGELVEAYKIWNLMMMLHMVFGEMLDRGIGDDNEVFASLVYGVVS